MLQTMFLLNNFPYDQFLALLLRQQARRGYDVID